MSQKKFKPRNFTALGLAAVWFLISLFFIWQGTLLGVWIPFAAVALLIGSAALWVLLNDTLE